MKCHQQYVCLLLQVISFVVNCLAENLILNINFKKSIAVTDHPFLSFILDPTKLQRDNLMKVLLNNESSHLINDKELPDINQEIIINPDSLELELPSGNIDFRVIPNAKVKACICSEGRTIENNVIKKLSKRDESNFRQDDQNEERYINQSNVIEDNVKRNTSESNLKNRKINEKQDRNKQKNTENTKGQQKVVNSKLLDKIKQILQKQLQNKDKSESPNLQRSFIIDLGEEQGNSSEGNSSKKQQNLNKENLKKKLMMTIEMEVDDNFENVQDILKKYKCILLEKKAKMETEGTQDFQSEIQNIDNIVELISKVDAVLLRKVTSSESILSAIKGKSKNEEESINKMSKKLKEYLIELENSPEIKLNIIRKIGKYFNKLYNLLENNNAVKQINAKYNKNNKVSIHEDLIKEKRLRRHVNRKSENSKNPKQFKKRSRTDNLKDHMAKQKIKVKSDNRKELISSDNSKRNFNDNENKYNNLLQRNPVKRFFKSDTFENAAHHADYQHLIQKHKGIEGDNIYTKRSKIGDMEKYQNLMQDPDRTKRDINRKLVEIGLRKDSAYRKRSRIDDLKNYINERKTKQKDDIKREGLLVPFNPKIIDSEENFYGFFRRDPIKGFPNGDIFIATGDSLEKNGKDYDYVEDEDNSNDKKNTQHNKKSMLDHTEGNTWIEKIEENGCDYRPNEFFENVKLSNVKIKENSQIYDDLWEAEFSSEERNNKNNNNNKITAAEVIQEQPPNREKNKRIEETNMQHTQLVNYHDNSKKQEYNRDALQLASRYPSISYDELFKILTSNINYQTSNVEQKEAKLKMEPETKISNLFYLPPQVSTAKYNYDNYQISNMNHDKVKLKDEKDFVINDNTDDTNAKPRYSRSSVYVKHPTHDKIFHKRRNKRSNWEEFRKIFTEEMIKENEENAKDCHRRVIRASNLPNTSSENKNMSTDITQSKENVQISMTREEYDKIIAGEILPSVIEPVLEENSTTMESVITESNTLDHKLNNTTQVIDVSSISGIDNISEQYHNMKKFNTNLPTDSASQISLNNNNNVNYITKKTFFRTQPSDGILSKNKTKTDNSPQVTFKIPSEVKGNRKELIISITRNTQETVCEKAEDSNNEKEKIDSSIYPTITENQKNEERDNNNSKIGLKLTNFFTETSKGITTDQVTTETISKRAVNTAIDNSKSNESKTNSKLLRDIKDNQNNESKVWMEKSANTRRLKILKNFPRVSLERLTKYEGHLTKRTEQIDKLKEKLHAKQETLLHQYRNKLTKTADEQKKNLKKRETWERHLKNDSFHQLIDQEEFIGVLLNDDVNNKDDDENDLIPIELVPKQYKDIIDKIYLLVKVKKTRYPEYNKYYKYILQNLIEDDEKLETSKSSEHKYNEHILKIIKDNQKAEASEFSKNHLLLVFSRKEFKEINQENEKEHKLNYITLIPIEIKNETLKAKNNDSLEHFDIPIQWDDQNILEKISDLMSKYLDTKASEEFEFEDLLNLQSQNTENIPDKESSCENEQYVSLEDNKAESEKNERYGITPHTHPHIHTNNEINKYLKTKNQIESNKPRVLLLLPWRNVKEKQRRQIKNEINESTVEIKHEKAAKQSNKSILLEDLENKRTKRYLNNNIDQEEKENIIKINDIKAKYLQAQTNKKNCKDLENFIKTHEKNNLYNNEDLSLKNKEKDEIILLNGISGNNKLLEKASPKLQNQIDSVDDSKANINDATSALDEDKHYRNTTFETPGNALYTAIWNIKDFFAFFSKITQIFMQKF